MVQVAKSSVRSGIRKLKTLYSFAVVANMILAVGHIGYAIMEYDKLSEPALWFFSGALAMIFNVALNTLCLRECNKLNYLMAMISNLVLLVFSMVLVIVTTEIQTVFFAVLVLYTSIVCYNHNMCMAQKQD